MSSRPGPLSTTRAFGAALLFALFSATGCDRKEAIGPPPAASETEEATRIGVVLPAGGFPEIDVWEAVARRQEARTRAVAEIYRLTPEDPPAKQAELIRKAADEGCQALIVLAFDADAVAPAVAEVRKEGMPVVLLETPVPSLGLPPAPLVQYEDEKARAVDMVDLTIKEALKAGFPADGPAIIMCEKLRRDPHTRARIGHLRDALKEKGVRVLPDLEFEGLVSEAKEALKVALEITPHIAMAFAMDDLSLQGASEFRHTLDKDKRRFVLSGYAIEPQLVTLAQYNITAALIERNVTAPMRAAYDAALALSRGETVPTDIRTPTPMNRRMGPEDASMFSPIIQNPKAAGGMNTPEKSASPARKER